MTDNINDLPPKDKAAFDLPNMICKEIKFEDSKRVFEEWNNSKHSFSFYKTESNEYKCLFTEFGEEEFLMFSILIHRHVQLYNLLKIVLLDAEKMREIPCKDHDFTYKALEYIRLKKIIELNPLIL